MPTPTTYQIALDEFRDASAAVRRAFGAVSEARELQIIADSQHKAASLALGEAQERMDHADKALAAAREAPAGAVTGANGASGKPAPVFASFREPEPVIASDGTLITHGIAGRYSIAPDGGIEPGHADPDAQRGNGAVIDANAAGIGIG